MSAMEQDVKLSPARWAWITLGSPVAVLFIAGVIARMPVAVIAHALVGMLGATIGGITAGVTAKRFLAHAKGDGEVLYGLGAVTAIGVVAVGYLYVFYIDNEMRTIGTPARAIEQVCIFVEFLVGQYAGTRWAERVLPGMRQGAGSKGQESEV